MVTAVVISCEKANLLMTRAVGSGGAGQAAAPPNNLQKKYNLLKIAKTCEILPLI